ncbi:tyrosine-type recombinase/integrase [Streptomyces noursei]
MTETTPTPTGPGRPRTADALNAAAFRRRIRETTDPTSLALFLECSSYRPATITSYAQDVRGWLSYTRTHGVDVLNPTEPQLAHWINVWHTAGPDGTRPRPTVAVRRNRRKALRAYSRHLVKAGICQGYPLAGIRVERDKTRRKASPRTLTPPEIAAFLDAARAENPGVYMTARLLADLGPRTWETAEARRSAWLASNKPPIVRLGGQGRGAVADRELGPCTVAAYEDYDDWIRYVLPTAPRRLTDPLLLVPSRRFTPPIPLTDRRLERLVHRLAVAADLSNPQMITPRTFRQAWIRHALAIYHLTDVAEAVGHLSPSSTIRYSTAGTIPVSPYGARIREAVGRSVVRGVLLYRALEGGEEQPALRELMQHREDAARLRSDAHLLRELEAARAESAALRRRVEEMETRAGTYRYTSPPPTPLGEQQPHGHDEGPPVGITD